VLWPPLKRAVTHCEQGVGVKPLFMLRCDRSPFASAHFDSGRWLAKNPSPPRRASGEDGKTDSVFEER
jgi:hypothetical protein